VFARSVVRCAASAAGSGFAADRLAPALGRSRWWPEGGGALRAAKAGVGGMTVALKALRLAQGR
jgi:hypothetical protein